MQTTQIFAALTALYIAYCWFLFVRKRYEPLFVLPLACFSVCALLRIMIVFIYAERLLHPAAELFGVFLLITLITGATLKPNRNFVWLLIALTTYWIVAGINRVIANPSAFFIAVLALEVVGALSLFYIVQFRPATLDRHGKSVKSVFE